MTAIAIVSYMHDLREAGFTDRQSEVQALRLEQVIKEAKQDIKQELELDGLATKKDLDIVRKELDLAIERVRAEIQQTRYDALKFTVWTGVSVVVVLGGMIAKGFHWF